MDLSAIPATQAALWALAALVSGAIAVRAVRAARDRGPWAALALAMLLLCASDAAGLGTTSPTPVGPWWGLALDLVAYALLYVAQLRLLRQRLAMHLPGAVLDTLGGLAISLSLSSALLLDRLEAVAGLDSSQALLLVARPAVGLLVLVFSVASLLVGGSVLVRRSWLVAGAVLLVFLMDAAAVVVVLNGGASLGLSTTGSLTHLLPPLVLLLAHLSASRPPGERRDEDAHLVLTGPTALLVASGAVLGLAHFTPLPTPAVLSALACLVLVGAKVVIVFRRVTALNDSRRQALTDDLTGLGNRRALGAALAGVDSGAAAALVLVDLDGFKDVNDELGHVAGDRLLQLVAHRLAAGTRVGEVVARQGGDEFALVLPGGGADDAADRARELVARLGEPYDLAGRRVVVAASAGVSAAPEHGRSSEGLLRQADAAMYLAKTSGRGVVVHDHAVEEERRERLQLAADLREAVAQGSLAVHYQPQLDAATSRLVGVEALVRWPHPVRGLLAPGAFLDLAEELGLMDDLTEQVLAAALAAAAGWRYPGTEEPVRVAVNVSATCLRNPRLIDTVARALLVHGVAPGDLLLEITETELMLDPDTSHRVVSALVDLGVGVSIDDYGSGYSSLAYLRDLPASELKLDRTFVAAMTGDPRATAIVRTTVDLAHSLGLRLVAEGVEDALTLAHLRDLGVDTTQGYLHSRPLPADQLRTWIHERSLVAVGRG